MAVCGGIRRFTVLLAATALGVALATSAQAGHDLGKKPPGQFDYYVLALSSVPGFCATNTKTPGECHKGLTFALHGLWPQDNGGDWPSNCSAAALTPADQQAARGVFADDSMVAHEWPKHGTCSGLKPADYFALATRIRRGVKIPAAYGPKTVIKLKDAGKVAAAFEAANPGLKPADLQTKGTKKTLTEVDVCVTKTGAFRAC